LEPQVSKTLSVTDLVRNFSEYINQVAYRGEHLVLTRGNKVIAEIRPLPVGRKLGDLPGILESLPHLSEREAEAFGKEISEARAELSREGLRDRWES